jgi:hypothetical protein
LRHFVLKSSVFKDSLQDRLGTIIGENTQKDAFLQEPALVEKIRARMPELNFSPYVQKGLPGVKLSPKINEQNYDCVWDNAGGTAKGYNASLDYWEGWFGPCCIPKGSKPPRNPPGPGSPLPLLPRE